MSTASAAPSATAAPAADLTFDGHETKNTKRFTERDANGEMPDAPVIGTIYLPKATLAAIGDPATVRVSVEAA